MSIDQIAAVISAIGAVMLLAGVGGVAWFGVTELRLRAIRRGRLQNAGGAGGGPGRQFATGAVSRGQGLGDQLLASVRRLGQQSAVRDPAQLSVLRKKLTQAGFYSREAPVIFLGIKAAALAVATVGVVMTLPMILAHKGGNLGGLMLAGVLAGAAIMGPEQVLKSLRVGREREYSDGFPDLLDLLVASVEAGLSLDAAVSRVTEELVRRYPNLVAHLRFLILELRAGKARKDAWTAFAERLGIDDARQMATMLRQAEEMGTSLGDTLTTFSKDMRAKRMLRAEEKALGLAAKLTVPLILFIFPCLIGALLLPAIARLAHLFPN
jgi:tight adherence protein C